METIIIQSFMMLINLMFMVYNYDKKNYKLSLFSSFASGVCFLGLITSI